MKPAKQDSQEARPDHAPGKAQGKARQRRRSITVRLSRKVKLIYTWRARHRLPRLLLRLLTQAFASLLAGFTGHAIAAPDGGTVASGSASISKPTTYQTIVKQDTPRAVINWNSYNVAAGERVTYQQPTASSVTLNRVVGGDLSKIYGSIDANGVVVISNPAGVYFGQGAQVNVGGLVAGAMAISDADFNAGNYRFTGNGSGSVKNEGNIQAGPYGVALIGHTVDNSGRIESGGAVLMGAGGQATLKLANDRLVDIAVDSSAVQAQVSNTGVIHADGGNIVLSARATDALLDTVLLAGGEMRADSLREVNGKIVLDGGSSGVVKVDGTLQARGLNANEKGGEVKVTGERILLASNSLIDVSGQAGGGQVHVGGGYQGKDPTIAHATDVAMAKGAVIRADATTKGDGGEVVLWSDHGTAFAGHISARGGAEGGNGGRVETSGKYLQSTGSVNASAPKGEAGSWLLDPYDITIGYGTNTDFDYDNGVYTGITSSTFLNANDLSTALTEGTNVTVSTGAGGSQVGNISLTGRIESNSSTATSLTLQAAGQILMDSGSQISANNGPLNVTLQAGGSINMDQTASINTKGGSLVANGAAAELINVNTGGGNITVTANNGNASLVDVQTGSQLTGRGSMNVNANMITLSRTEAGAMNLSAQQHIRQVGKVTATGKTSLSVANVDGDIVLSNTTNDFRDSVKIAQAHNATIANNGALQIEGSVTGDLNVTANGSITQSNALSVEGASALHANGNDITLDSIANHLNGAVSIQSARNVFVVSDSLQIEGSASGDLTATALFGSLTQSGALSVSGQSNLAAHQDIDLQNAANSLVGPVNLQTTVGNASLANNGDLALSASIGNDLSLTTQGKTTFGHLSVGGSLDAASSNGFEQTGAAVTVVKTATFDGAIINPFDNITPVTNSNILLTGASNDFRDIVAFRHAADVSIKNTGALQLEGTISGLLNVAATGPITQSNTLNVMGDSVLKAGGSDITLTNAANNFQGNMSVSDARNVSIVNVTKLTYGGHVSGDLNIDAKEIGQSSAIEVEGKATLKAADNIYLDNTSNSFTGPLHLETTLGEARVYNKGDLTLTAKIATDLFAVATGAITQGAGSVVASGAADIVANGVDFGGAGNQFGSLSMSSSTGAVVAGTITGNLTVYATGISQRENALTVGAATYLHARSGDITLTHSDNGFTGPVLFDTSASANIKSKSALQLEGSAGNLTVEAGGSITQSGSIFAQNVQLTATGANHDITLDYKDDSGHNEFTGTVQFSATRDVTLVNVGALRVTGEAGGDLSLTTSTGAITQTGILKAGGTTTVTTQGQGDQIQLSNAANNFTRDLTLNSAGAAEIAGHVGGKLAVTANGDITQGTNPLTVDGETKLTVSGAQGAITLDQDSNVFSQKLAFSGPGKVKIFGSNDLILEGSAGDTLDVKSAGSLGQSAKLDSGNTTTFTSTGTDKAITLNDSANEFAGATTLDGVGDVSVRGNFGNSLTVKTGVGNVTMSGTVANGLEVTAGQAIIQGAAPIVVTTGATILKAGQSGTGNNYIELGGTGNVFGGSLTTLSGKQGVALGGHVKGDLAVTSEGIIEQADALTVDHKSTFIVNNNPFGKINLSDSNNVFAEGVSFSAADKVKLASAGPLQLEGTAGSLDVNAAGSITQGTALTVTTGPATFTTTGANHNITLANDGNVFNGDVALNSAGNADIHAKGEVKLSGAIANDLTVKALDGSILQTDGLTVDVGGKSSFTTTSSQGNTRATDVRLANDGNVFAGDIALASAGNADIHGKGDVKLSGAVANDLAVKAVDGSILQTDGLTVDVGGKSSFTTTRSQGNTRATDVKFANDGNVFAGDIALASAGNADIHGKGDVKLSGAVANDLTVKAVDGSILQTDGLTVGVGGKSSFSTTSSQGNTRATDVNLANDGNVFAGDITLASAGDASIYAKGDVQLSGSVARDLTANAKGGSILQGDGAVTVMRDTSLTTRVDSGNPAAATDIILENPGNAFMGQLWVSSAGKVAIKGKGDLKLSGGAIGNLKVEAIDGSILQGTRSLYVGGASELTTTSSPGNSRATDIVFDDLNNKFEGAVTLNTDGKASLAGSLNLSVGGRVGQDFTAKSIDGFIVQGSSPLTVGGSSTFSTSNSPGNTNATGIVLDNPDNRFDGAVSLDTGGKVILAAKGDLLLGGAVGDTLSATATGGSIKQGDSALQVTNGSSLSTVATNNGQPADVELNNPANSFGGPVALDVAGNASLAAAGNVTVNGKVAGELAVKASGDIGQNAAIEVDGTTKLAAGGNISLGNAQNDFKNTVTVEKAVDVEIRDRNTLDTQGTATGNVVLTAKDDLTQAGPWQVGGTSTLTSQNGNVEFNNPNNQFAGVVTPTAPNDVELSAQTPVTVAPNAGGNVTINAPQVSVVGGSVGGNLTTTGKTYLSRGVVVVGANGPAILQSFVQRAVTASLTPLTETGPGSYRNYLLLANPPVFLQNSVLPSVEGSGILLPDDEKKWEPSSQ